MDPPPRVPARRNQPGSSKRNHLLRPCSPPITFKSLSEQIGVLKVLVLSLREGANFFLTQQIVIVYRRITMKKEETNDKERLLTNRNFE